MVDGNNVVAGTVSEDDARVEVNGAREEGPVVKEGKLEFVVLA